MLRDRLLRSRWLVYLIVAWGVVLAAVPHPADAAPFPPARAEGTPGDPDAALIRERLLGLGVSPADVAVLLARLTPAERAELAARADELAAGGNTVALIAVSIIFVMLVILILELMGRRVISRSS